MRKYLGQTTINARGIQTLRGWLSLDPERRAFNVAAIALQIYTGIRIYM